MLRINRGLTLAEKRKQRVRRKVKETIDKPRVSVFRSNKHMYVQVIDDQTGKVLAAANELNLSKAKKLSGTKTERATQVAEALAADLKTKKITSLRFDRAQYKYHGRVKVIAEVLRAQGVQI